MYIYLFDFYQEQSQKLCLRILWTRLFYMSSNNNLLLNDITWSVLSISRAKEIYNNIEAKQITVSFNMCRLLHIPYVPIMFLLFPPLQFPGLFFSGLIS